MSLWLIRAGSQGEQEEGALANNVVTIGWDGGWEKTATTFARNEKTVICLIIKINR
jgi:predicted Mrr-cat superfamily restriction endonuclease